MPPSYASPIIQTGFSLICFFGCLPNGGTYPALSAAEAGRRWLNEIGFDVAESEHLGKSILLFRVESAFRDISLGIVKRAEDHVPNWEVRVILSMMAESMVETVGLGTLDEKSEPAVRAHIPMIEIFSDGDEQGVISGGLDGAAEKCVYNRAAED